MDSAQVNLGTPCSQLVAPSLPGAEVLQISSVEVHNYNFPEVAIFNAPAVTNLDFCNVSLSLRHTGADDTVYVDIWLPLHQKDWNGRYQATGGGGLAAGMGPLIMSAQVAEGYAASATDGGLTKNQTIDPQSGRWALREEDGKPDGDLQLNLAWRSIHDMAVVSKDVIKQFYGTDPNYSYWNGCSQGGRQGYAAAAKYPDDFDGILAVAPAIDMPSMVASDYFPPVVLRNSEEIPPECVFVAYQNAMVEACDSLDGVTDGFISTPESLEKCSVDFNPDLLVGKTIACDDDCLDLDPSAGWVRVPCRKTGEELTVTGTHAEIIRKLLAGPHTVDGESRLWYGMAPGAGFDALARVVVVKDPADGKNRTHREVAPFVVAENWLKYFALQDPTYDMIKMTHEDYIHAHQMSVDRLTPLWGNQQLDLSEFSRSGGKLLTWFGLADEYITPFGMVRFRDDLQEKFGGSDAVDEWYRLFFAPGVGHCAGGIGPNPVDPLGALVSWVERDEAPEVLPAAKTTDDGVRVTRDLCRFPKTLVYKRGDVNDAGSFTCEEPSTAGGGGNDDDDDDGGQQLQRHEEL